MERRSFLKGALAIFGAVAVGAAAGRAEAAPLDKMPNVPSTPAPEPANAADATEDAQGQYYYRRRYRYRPRRRVYYYRPRRRVYYYRRPVYYRRIYW